MSDDRTAGRGLPGNQGVEPGGEVTEGGVPPAPVERHGMPKASASKADDEGRPDEGTTPATAGKAEKQHAAAAGALKTQSGRGHRKD